MPRPKPTPETRPGPDVPPVIEPVYPVADHPVPEHPTPARRRNIALVAHDNMKDDLLDWAQYNAQVLGQHHLFATGTTGSLVEAQLGLPVTRFLSGPLGGDQQLGAAIAAGGIDLLLFFWDPLEPQPHDPDVRALLRIAIVWNVVVASNRASADYVISSPLLTNDYEASRPVYDRPSTARRPR